MRKISKLTCLRSASGIGMTPCGLGNPSGLAVGIDADFAEREERCLRGSVPKRSRIRSGMTLSPPAPGSRFSSAFWVMSLTAASFASPPTAAAILASSAAPFGCGRSGCGGRGAAARFGGGNRQVDIADREPSEVSGVPKSFGLPTATMTNFAGSRYCLATRRISARVTCWTAFWY